MITKQDIIKGLQELGIKGGDNIFVTSSLSRFGYVAGGAKTVVDALIEVVDNGTIVMPSFNFSIFKKKEIVLDIGDTPSEMGAITEEFRRRDVYRTTNLFHPLCVMGNLSAEILSCDMIDTWGNNSPYDLMERYNFKAVLLGTDFYSFPFIHYAEQKNNVPYREPIEYEGYIKSDSKLKVKCRRLRRKYGDTDGNRIYSRFPTREVKLGNAICRSFDILLFMAYLDSHIKCNPDYLLSENDLLSYMPTMDDFNMILGIRELFREKRNLVSQGFKNSLDYISKFIPLRYHTWKAGEKIETWVIPKGDIDTMYIGEFTVRGYSPLTILLPIHLDHDGMANDNLSGVAVAIKLALRLLRTTDLHYTYKFLFVPETIGMMAYLSKYGLKDILFGIVIDSVGTNDSLVVTKTKFNSVINKYIESNTNEFLSNAHLWSGNDERVLECWKIPALQFSRHPFLQYHTAKDTPDIIRENRLNEVLDEVYNFILRVERDFIPVPTYRGVPCLSAIDLWKEDLGIEKMYHLIGYNLSIADIAKIIDMPFRYVYDFVRKLENKGYAVRKNV